MWIYFFTKQSEICNIIAKRLNEEKIQTLVFDNLDIFFQLMYSKKKLPDLFVFDYRVFQHDIFNVYRYMENIQRLAPLIFYNDPYPDPKIRVNYWLYQCSLHIKNTDCTALEQPFTIIAKTISSPSLNPYISIIQQPLPFPAAEFQQEEFESVPEKKEINIYEFRKREKIQPSVFRLLKYLYERRNTYISIEELEKNILGKDQIAKRGSVYSYISRLRSYMKRESSIRMDIIQSHKRYKLVIF